MYALSFDMRIADLEEHYGNPYHGAYFEIKRTLAKHEFYWIQGSTYMTNANNLINLFNAVNALKAIDWFRKSVRVNIRLSMQKAMGSRYVFMPCRLLKWPFLQRKYY